MTRHRKRRYRIIEGFVPTNARVTVRRLWWVPGGQEYARGSGVIDTDRACIRLSLWRTCGSMIVATLLVAACAPDMPVDGRRSPADIETERLRRVTCEAKLHDEPRSRRDLVVMEGIDALASFGGAKSLHVSPFGSDRNDGSLTAPLMTIGEGLRRALTNRSEGFATRIILFDGVYREGISRYLRSSGPPISLEALNVGHATISGADVFDEWTCSDRDCEHAWHNAWGTDRDPWSKGVGELARRREMVLVDGVNLAQVQSRQELSEGSFYVDEEGSRLIVRPPEGPTLAGRLVEVAVRPHLLRLQGLDNIVIRGVRFHHAASPFTGAAVEIVDQHDVTIERSWFEWNGQVGLSLKGSELVVRDSVMNRNGSSGVTGYQVMDILLQDSESSYNNWRGIRSGYTDWDVGNKFFAAHRLIIRGHTAVHNQSRGLWFDTDIADVEIDDSVFSHNLSDGVFFEKVQGPLVVRQSSFDCNGGAGILTSTLNHFVLERNALEYNGRTAVLLSGQDETIFNDFETGRRFVLGNSNWVWHENVFLDLGAIPVVTTTLAAKEWWQVVRSSHFDANTYIAGTEAVFQLYDGQFMTLPQWRSLTGQDHDSDYRLYVPEH